MQLWLRFGFVGGSGAKNRGWSARHLKNIAANLMRPCCMLPPAQALPTVTLMLKFAQIGAASDEAPAGNLLGGRRPSEVHRQRMMADVSFVSMAH